MSASPTTSSTNLAPSAQELLDRHLDQLAPGVTELLAHPAVDAPELRRIATDWSRRVADHDLLNDADGVLARRVEDAGVHLIGYRQLRDVQRSTG